MRLATLSIGNKEQCCVRTAGGYVPVQNINAVFGTKFPDSLSAIIREGVLEQLKKLYAREDLNGAEFVPVRFEEAEYAPLFRDPARIFGIGLNYRDHAGDLGEKAPEVFPGCFYKPASCITGHGGTIMIPAMPEATKTTAEGELAVIFGKACKNTGEDNWSDYVAGYTTALDMTEESILRLNPRYLTLVKGFDTFCAIGPEFVTADEVEDVLKLEVQSVHNGEIYAKNTVSNMTHKPARLVSLISKIQGWLPADILLTGTPRAFAIADGDTAECRIFGPDGFSMEPLCCPVEDLKKEQRI